MNKAHPGRKLASLTLAFSLVTAVALAQQLATLSGNVTDGAAAALPNVTLTLVNDETGASYTARTNEDGFYTIPLVKPGNYTLAVEAAGFKKYQRAGLLLETGTPARADVALEIGQVSEVVNVNETAPLLQTESSSVGNVIRNESIANLPLAGRRAAQLARLSGFVVQNGTSGSNFTMAGGRGDNSNWTIDGGNAQNVLLGVATLNFDLPVDSLQEFRVEISNYKAELGRTGGGVVQFTTRSGTNQWHGSAYEFFRNDALDARSFFAADKPTLRYNQFGGSLGGPIRKDRTHFFFNYEGTRNNRQAVVLQGVPTRAEVGGDFSGLTNAAGQPVLIKDPANTLPCTAADTRGCFPGNVIPANRIDPVGAALAAFYPAPNVPGARTRTNNFRANRYITGAPNVTVSRLDHSFSQSDKIFGRFLSSKNHSEDGSVYPQPGTDNGHASNDGYYYSVTGTWFHTFAATTTLETRYAWDQRKNHEQSGGIGLGLAEQIGLKGTNPNYFPQVTLTGLPTLGTGSQERQQFPIIGHHLASNLTQVRGNHTLKFGGEYRYSRNTDNNFNNAGGTFGFNTTATGDALAALLLGHVSSASRAELLELISHAATVGLFGQTDWKIKQKLTLNLGLRYDLDLPRWESNNRQSSFDPTALNPVCNCPGVVTWSGRDGRSKYAHNFDKNNFGPRLGFAWSPAEKWVVRGGGALVYIGAYDLATPARFNLGFSSRVNLTSPDGGRTAALRLRDGLPPIPEPSEAELVPGFGAVPVGQNPVLSVEYLQPSNRPTPYLQTFNLNLQRELPWEMVAEIGYLGTFGHKLTPGGDNHTLNQVAPDRITTGNVQRLRPFPQFTDVVIVADTVGNSSYHGLNLKLEKRLARGLQFITNYTWSKLIDDVESRNEVGGNGGTNAFANQYDRRADRGLSGNHIGHRFIASTVWELPVGRQRWLSVEGGALNQMVGGWSLGLIFERRSGSPFGAVENNGALIFPTAQTVRSNLTGTFTKNPNWRQNVLGENYFDITAFAAPAYGTFGTTARTIAFGPGAVYADLSLLKNFRIREGHTLQFRTEMLNFLNHPNFGLPNQTRGNPQFGRINGLGAGTAARIIQLGLQYRF